MRAHRSALLTYLHIEIFSIDVRRSYGNIHGSRRVEVSNGEIIQIIGVCHDLQRFTSLFIQSTYKSGLKTVRNMLQCTLRLNTVTFFNVNRVKLMKSLGKSDKCIK